MPKPVDTVTVEEAVARLLERDPTLIPSGKDIREMQEEMRASQVELVAMVEPPRENPVLKDLETLFTSAAGFGITTASPLQRALCRVIEGRPLGNLIGNEEVEEGFGCPLGDVPSGNEPAEVCVVSGIRAGKSRLAAALAVRMVLKCNLDGLQPGETARVSVVSLKVDLANVVMSHLIGTLESQPGLKNLITGKPTSDGVTIKRPHDGKHVEIRVVAGARAGASLVARWSAGCIFDEAPRMLGQEEGIVNLDDAVTAVRGRLREGAQIIYIGSPWQPFGPIWEMVDRHWGAPTRHIVVVRAPAWAMNPIYWTPEKCDELREARPEAAHTDLDAQFADPGGTLFGLVDLERVTREGPLELMPDRAQEYWAAIDPATRANAWTFVVVTRRPDGVRVVVLARQWRGIPSDPLDPREVFAEMAEILEPYRCEVIRTDQFSADALRAIADDAGLALTIVHRTAEMNRKLYADLETRVRTERIELPPDRQVQGDLLAVRKRPTHNGVMYVLPKTGDGRHADYAAALSLALSWQLGDPEPDPVTEEDKLERRLMDELEREEEWNRNDVLSGGVTLPDDTPKEWR